MESNKQIVEKTDSCKIVINAKGQWSGEVKGYAENLDTALQMTLDFAEKLEETIKQKNTGDQ